MMPSTSPGARSNATPRSGRLVASPAARRRDARPRARPPGAAAPCPRSRRRGRRPAPRGGDARGARRPATSRCRWRSRPAPSARPSRNERRTSHRRSPPGWMTSQAPAPRITVCTIRRKNFEEARMTPPRVPAAARRVVGAGAVAPPQAQHALAHAHGADHFGVAQRRLGALMRLAGGHVGALQRLLGDDLVDDGEAEQDGAAAEADEAQHGMEREQRDDEDRRPGRVEQRRHRRTGDEIRAWCRDRAGPARRGRDRCAARRAARPRTPSGRAGRRANCRCAPASARGWRRATS